MIAIAMAAVIPAQYAFLKLDQRFSFWKIPSLLDYMDVSEAETE